MCPGSGIGHDLQLVIDGDMSKTYVLNDHFTYDFGTYTSGSGFLQHTRTGFRENISSCSVHGIFRTIVLRCRLNSMW